LWSSGGDRGLFKTIDGGTTWTKVLGDDHWTGVTDIALDPRNPDRLYAATWQRQRTIATYVGGGPGSGIYRSDDGGDTWTRLIEGLPEGNIGKIGLAVSPRSLTSSTPRSSSTAAPVASGGRPIVARAGSNDLKRCRAPPAPTTIRSSWRAPICSIGSI
jgi:hypothetical protein